MADSLNTWSRPACVTCNHEDIAHTRCWETAGDGYAFGCSLCECASLVVPESPALRRTTTDKEQV